MIEKQWYLLSLLNSDQFALYYSTIVIVVFIFFHVLEYVDPCVLFSTLKWLFTYSKKRGLQFFTFIHVLNFWVPERACVIYHAKKKLYVLKFEYIKGLVINGYMHQKILPQKG